MALDTIQKNILMSSERFNEEKQFWSERLNTVLELTNHSLRDFEKDMMAGYEKSISRFSIPVAINDRILSITRQSKTGYYMMFVSVVNMILENHVNGEQISIGIPVVAANEKQAEHLSLLLPLIMSTTKWKELPFVNYLSELVENVQSIDRYKNIPIEFIRECLGLEGINTYRETNHAAVLLEGVQERDTIETLQLDLLFALDVNNHVSTFEIIYNAHLFDEVTIQRLGRLINHVLGFVSTDPKKKLAEIGLIDPEDREIILHDFNDTKRVYPREKSIVEIFEEQCRRYPAKSALVYQGEVISYQQLNERSNQVARMLQKLGVKQESVIGITIEQGFERFAIILGILKAGGAFLPIDDAYPNDRKEYMLKDSGATLLITSKHQNYTFAFNGEIITLTDKILEPIDKTNLKTYPTPRNLAYIMYTSGSTGKPKGVMVEHRNIVRLVKCTEFIDLQKNARMLQGSTIVFDASTLEVWGALLNGMELHLVDKETMLDPIKLEMKLIDDDITIMWMTAPLFNQISKHNPAIFRRLRYLLVGGDALSIKPIEKVRKACPDLTILNGYGPTENTTFSTTFLIEKPYQKTIPIGKPITNSIAYILNTSQKLQPIGAIGEIYVGGDGVARGYVNNESLNQEKFIEDPFDPKGRLYRTGDLGRWLADGNIEFFGRTDDQVKIRGFRIEIGEIESALTEHPHVRESVILLQEREKKDKYISAYVVLEETGNVEEVKKEIKKKLPDYMQPSYLLAVDEIPLTRNGKVDRETLINKGLESLSVSEVTPSNEVEVALLAIWKEVFQLENIGLYDNFYELGGNSLIAIKLISVIRDQLNCQCQLADILIHVTIKDLARFIVETREEMKLEKKETSHTEQVENTTNVYEASALQQRIYMVDVMKNAGISYNIPLFIKTKGNLDQVGFEAAINQLVKRHESLRTRFQFKEQKLYQVIDCYKKFPIPFKQISSEQVEEEVKAFVRPFDLHVGPLFRVEVLELSREEFIIMMDVHHIVSDGRSTEVMVDEMIAAYNGRKLPKLEYQYKDFTELQKRKMAEKGNGANESYWEKQFEDGESLVEFPLDYEANPMQTFEGAEVKMEIDKDLSLAMEEIANTHKVTNFVLYLGLLKTLLAKYTQKNRITIASPATHRTHSNWESVIGMFVNMIPICSEVQAEWSVTDFIKRISGQVLDAHRHMDYDFNSLVGKLGGTRSSGDNPIFNVTFDMHHHEIGQRIENESIDFELMEVDSNIAKFDLSIVAIKKETGIQFVFQYNTGLFKQETIERLANYFSNIISQVCANTALKISEITLANQQDRERIVYQFNDTKKNYPREKTLIDLFDEQCVCNPMKTALVYQGSRMSYQQLNERANQVAHLLIAQGVEVGTSVGVICKQGFDRIAAILGSLKVGGTFLPIDDEYPENRKKFMLENSEAKLLLTDSPQNEKLDFNGDVIVLTDDRLSLNKKTNIAMNVGATSLAYIMYTSGSTGKPKGVMVTHRNIVQLVKNTEFIEFRETDRILQSSAVVFDASTLEIWGALLNGLELHLVDKEMILNGRKLELKLIQDQITIMWMTAPLFNQISKHNPSMFHGLRYLLVGGDALSVAPIEKVRKACPNLTIVNGYGPTENTTFSTTHVINQYYQKSIPIGKPITNSTAYILDSNQNIQPIGAVGEIYVGGDGVARGYCGNESLTKEKFIVNPFVPGDRLYRTGDIGRWLADGTIEFLGRVDDQVKIRGFRIEIGEIESVLTKHLLVKDAVVLVREEEEGEKHIHAFVVLEDMKEDGVQKIRMDLKKKLPNYMQPSFITQVEKIPLTINGKVDKASLLNIPLQVIRDELNEPSTEVEEKLLEIWESILKSEDIGLDDNFFDIGGNSILLVSMYEKIIDIVHEEIEIADLFANPTIASLAEYIESSLEF
ncbi:amino acid adenylation domain-containing protein [Lysinibacillus xylanilyticus]|uniref:non-ribosomal peptide synthetase n=1 Tax=Lysinibacillus xylanilyticus TaxID=582475 RepID=UPI002B2437EF|nr:non-ribosomal peptide synthetase [Lysinibacillus xylanilyticus]MEB2302390.1 amino acid adenylation domain-containing protein [Lysinibacillus xylanilyticus]